MNINSTQLLSAFDQTRTLVAAEPESSGDFTTVEKVFEEKRSTPDAVVMVYGVYNAGKSTLINVLLGKEEAECDDIPLTDKVTSYAWGKFSILDTPGVDAPIEHQNVTKQQLLSADAVIFVVNPLGTVEEAKTLQVLVDLLERGKQVFLVFNEKKQLSDDDFVKLKDQVREQIQILANDRGMGGVLKQVPIVRINAKQALFGRLKNVPELIERSGFPTLESQLLDFLNSISPNDVYGNLKHLLVSYLNTQVEHLTSTAPESGLVKKYDVFLRNLAREKAALRTDLLQKIDSEAREIRQRTKRVLRLDSDNAQSNIEALLTQASKGIEQHLEYRLQEIVAVAQGEIDALQASVPKVESYTHNAEVQFEMEGTDTAESTSGKRERPTISPEMLTEISKQLGSAAKPEHIVNVLAGVKKVLPSLMKGIGPRTMEKWASAVVGKWVPYIGTAVSVGMALRDMFAEDPEEAAHRKQIEAQRLARERAEQQLEDFAAQISDGFVQFMREAIPKGIDEFFTQVEGQVADLRGTFDEAEQRRSQRFQQWVSIQQLAINA